MLLFYVRHGEPIYNPDSLTERGYEQAEAVAKRLAQFGVDRIFASSSNRAIQTAEPTGRLTGLPITTLDFCNEYRVWEHYTVTRADGEKTWVYFEPSMRMHLVSEEVRRLDERWYEHPAFAGYSFADGVREMNAGTDEFMQSLGFIHDRSRHGYCVASPNEERVALFAHEGASKAFLSSLLDIPYPMFSTHTDICHTGMTVIHFPTDSDFVIPRMLQHSGNGHLYKEGLSTLYNRAFEF